MDYPTTNGTANTTAQQPAQSDYHMQKRVYVLQYTFSNGKTETVGFIDIKPKYVKTQEKWSGLEQRLDHGLSIGTIKMGEGFSILASDKGSNQSGASDFQPLSVAEEPTDTSPF